MRLLLKDDSWNYKSDDLLRQKLEPKKFFFCFFFMLNVPVNNFFSHAETEPPLPSYYQYFWGVNMSCSRTKHGDPSGARTPTSGSGVRGVNNQATAPRAKTVISG